MDDLIKADKKLSKLTDKDVRIVYLPLSEEWDLLNQWIGNNGKYEFRSSGDHRNMYGFMEEHLNYINRVHLTDPEEEGCQLDLLMPTKEYL